MTRGYSVVHERSWQAQGLVIVREYISSGCGGRSQVHRTTQRVPEALLIDNMNTIKRLRIFKLLPLNGGRWLGAYVIHDATHIFYLIDDST